MKFAEWHSHAADPRSAEVCFQIEQMVLPGPFQWQQPIFQGNSKKMVDFLCNPRIRSVSWDLIALLLSLALEFPVTSKAAPSHGWGALFKSHSRDLAGSWAPKRILPEISLSHFSSDVSVVQENRINVSVVTPSKSPKEVFLTLSH